MLHNLIIWKTNFLSSLQFLTCLVVTGAYLLLSSSPGWGQPLQPKVLFDGTQIISPWKVLSAGDASYEKSSDGLRFTINAWQEGKDMWPRVMFQGQGIDLSIYSTVIVEIENPTDKAETIAISIAETTPRRVAQAVSIAPQSTAKVVINISDGAPMDQSRITVFNLYESRPLTSSTFVLKKVTAVSNPDYISARTALESRLTAAQHDAENFQKHARLSDDDASVFQASQQLIASAQTEFDQQAGGYITSVQNKLERAQQSIARLDMKQRNADLIIWTSPLGLAIRNGTLPKATDHAISAINQQVVLNEYQPFCVNISTAEKAKAFDVNLEAGSTPDKFITLRPALFVKARDGSMTADAIGTSTARLKLTIAPFQTEQFIVWINTKERNVKPGNYRASLKISSADKSDIPSHIPINVDVANVRLANSLPINVLNYAYFYMGQVRVTKGLEKEAVENLRDYGINTWVINYDQIPLPLLDDTGKYLGLNTTDRNRGARFHQVMNLLSGNPQETFILWLGFQRPEIRELLSRPRVLSGYIKDLHALMDEYHVPLDKRYIQFWDETQADQLQESIEWMKKIRALDPTFQFFDNTSSIPTAPQSIKDFSHLLGVLMPNWEQLFVAQPEEAKRAAALDIPHFGFYRCLMSRNNSGVNIYEYYRLMGWYLMQNGFDTLGFWTYNAGAGGDEWDGTTGSASGGTVVYQKDGQLFSSRRWELFREGLVDYKLMQAAFNDDGILDANKNSKLKYFCHQIINAPENLQGADTIRIELIQLAEKKISR